MPDSDDICPSRPPGALWTVQGLSLVGVGSPSSPAQVSAQSLCHILQESLIFTSLQGLMDVGARYHQQRTE